MNNYLATASIGLNIMILINMDNVWIRKIEITSENKYGKYTASLPMSTIVNDRKLANSSTHFATKVSDVIKVDAIDPISMAMTM